MWGVASWGGSSASAWARQFLGRSLGVSVVSRASPARPSGRPVFVWAHTCRACALLDRRLLPGDGKYVGVFWDYRWMRLQPGLVLGARGGAIPRCARIPGLRQPFLALTAKSAPRGAGAVLRNPENHHSPLPLAQSGCAGDGYLGVCLVLSLSGRWSSRLHWAQQVGLGEAGAPWSTDPTPSRLIGLPPLACPPGSGEAEAVASCFGSP